MHAVLYYINLCVLVLDFLCDAGALLSNLPAPLVIVQSLHDYLQAGAAERVQASM